MTTISGTFTGVGAGAELRVKRGEEVEYTITGSAAATLALEIDRHGGGTWEHVLTLDASTNPSSSWGHESDEARYRLSCTAFTSGTVTYSYNDSDVLLDEVFDKQGNVIHRTRESGFEVVKDLTVTGDTTLTGDETAAGDKITSKNVGTAASGTTAVEHGDGNFHKTILTVDTTLPAIAGGANLAVGKLIYTFPTGAIIVEAAYMSMAITQTQGNITNDTPDVGVGTEIASGTVVVLGGSGTFEDMITGQAADDCNGTAEVITIANQVLVIETGSDHTVHFNAALGWAASGDSAALLAGTVTLFWRFIE